MDLPIKVEGIIFAKGGTTFKLLLIKKIYKRWQNSNKGVQP
jgi:hypothetical protein